MGERKLPVLADLIDRLVERALPAATFDDIAKLRHLESAVAARCLTLEQLCAVDLLDDETDGASAPPPPAAAVCFAAAAVAPVAERPVAVLSAAAAPAAIAPFPVHGPSFLTRDAATVSADVGASPRPPPLSACAAAADDEVPQAVPASPPPPPLTPTAATARWLETACTPGTVESAFHERRACILASIEASVCEPMVLIPFDWFATCGQIPRSDELRRATTATQGGGSGAVAVEYDASLASCRFTVFVSHRWLRPGAATPHPDDARASKFKRVVAAVATLAAARGRTRAETFVWIDYACVDQDDEQRKARGIASLLGYVARCDALIVPACEGGGDGGGFTKQAFGAQRGFYYVGMVTGYGARAWCRLEAFTMWCVALLRRSKASEVRRHASQRWEGACVAPIFAPRESRRHARAYIQRVELRAS